MATVQFQCGHCHNLMAVAQESLGQQVRCPHCQQVVLAPAPSTSSPLPEQLMPTIEAPRLDEHESIFTPPETSGDDLFGGPAIPRVELPTEPAFPRMALDEPTLPVEAAPPAPVDDRTETLLSPVQPAAPSVTELAPPEPAATTEADTFAPPSESESPPVPDEEGLPVLTVPPRARVGRSNPWVIPLIIAPLAFYSFMATVYIIDTKYLHFMTPAPPPHPLEMLPDLEGDNKGAAGHGSKRASARVKLEDPDTPLPSQLRVPLGGTLTIGDLEVTPQRVERARHAWAIGNTTQPFGEDVLSLTLRLRNRSEDDVFKPMDRYFSRAWKKNDPTDHKPYTYLEMGDRKFYGGPLDWLPLNRAAEGHIQYVQGQIVNQELKPGEEMTTFVCTNPEEHVVRALENYSGPLLWRVQLRRGLVRWTTRDGKEREDPATAVIGVAFTAGDVRKPAG
jgi:hypothetical protein